MSNQIRRKIPIKERPILMSSPMVLALLDGRKTNTRRKMKIQPEEGGYVKQNGDSWNICFSPDHYKELQGLAWSIKGVHHVSEIIKCPYGVPGDRLYVKETWMHGGSASPGYARRYKADDLIIPGLGDFDGEPWRSSMFMPRWASRITLEIKDVRVERLQDISDADSVAEGIEPVAQLGIMRACGWKDYSGKTVGFLYPRDSYRTLWELINGSGSWNANPWVWRVAFRNITS